MRIRLIAAACCAALLFMAGCGNEPVPVSNQTSPPNSNRQSGNAAQSVDAAPTTNASSAPAKVPMGEPIDTSEYDARINRLEEQAKKKPNDEALKKQLAKAYLERGNALTQARQYQPALGDYRRALRYDPANEEARYWSGTIIGIMQQMNREVPREGAEPTPLQKQ